jgi:hypothetical protein
MAAAATKQYFESMGRPPDWTTAAWAPGFK